MTYHPIDKPTEPGWYWFCNNMGRYEVVLVVLVGGSLAAEFPGGSGGGVEHVKVWGDWFGPAIQSPQKENQ